MVTVAPSECAALVDPSTALVIPVKSLPDTPLYEINSVPTCILPVVGNPVVDVNVILVPDPPVPLASFNNAPFKVLVTAPVTVPFHSDTPQP